MISTCENIQTRISEIENVFLPTIKHDVEVTRDNLSQILEFQEEFDSICSKIDNFEMCLDRVNSDLQKLEKQVEIADKELGTAERNAPMKFLKTIGLFSRAEPQGTNLGPDGKFVPVEIFKSDDYFTKETEK